MKKKKNDFEILHRWRGMTLRRDNNRLPDGKTATYTFLKHPGSVVIVPLLNEDSVILVKQYRYPINRYSLEFPAGGKRKNETWVQAARRELIEETGYGANKFFQLGIFYPSNSISSEETRVFLANDLVVNKVGRFSEQTEDIKIYKMKLEELKRKVNKEKITDGFSIIATHFIDDYLKNNEKK